MAFSGTWKKIMDEINDFSQKNDGMVWYRGHNKASSKLNSGLFRLNISDNIVDYIRLEDQMYRYFKNLGHLLHGNEQGWNLLYSMQHHGVKTRLLDWTESFAVALFFATDGWNKGKACIWMLNPLKLNNESIGKEEVLSPSKVLYPDKYTDEKKNDCYIPDKRQYKNICSARYFYCSGELFATAGEGIWE